MKMGGNLEEKSIDLGRLTLTQSASNYATAFSKSTEKSKRKPLGQFFTPPEVAEYMASKVKLTSGEVSILDPCAGTGTLIAALCDKIMNTQTHSLRVIVHAYEVDPCLIPYLYKTLEHCKETFEKKGHEFEYFIIEENFIRKNSRYLGCNFNSKNSKGDLKYFDVVLSNPPYFRLKTDSKEYNIMNGFLNGQPNIYSSFVILSNKMLKENGQFVHIIPRSFCSGFHYKNIRKWIVENTCINAIHSFQSRSKIFDQQEVLQEVIVIYGRSGSARKCKTTLVSSSNDKSFSDYYEIDVPYHHIIHVYGEDSYIRIPTSQSQIDIIEIVDSWKHTLKDFGLTVSTGKVVDFRTKENLRDNFDEDSCVPLLWMQNLTTSGINLYPKNFNKKRGIVVNESTRNILVPIQNYVLLKRFTSKCNRRRLYVSPFFKSQFKEFNYIGFENHLNYIHGIDRSLNIEEVRGLCALLGSDILDIYFRAMNGSTQVNATDLLKVPMPDYDILCKLGDNDHPDRNRELLNIN